VPSPPEPVVGLFERKAPLIAAALVVLFSSTFAVGASAYVYRRFAMSEEAAARSTVRFVPHAPAPPLTSAAESDATRVADRELPADAAFTILVGSFPADAESTGSNVAATTEWLEASGFRVFYAQVHLGSRGRWQRVLAGAYSDSQTARRDLDRIRAAAPQSDAHLVSAGFAVGLASTAPRQAEAPILPSSTEP
jgi:hypothetical protein